MLVPCLVGCISLAALAACEDNSFCGTESSVCIDLAPPVPFEFSSLDALEVAVTYKGVTSSDWSGNQDDQAGLCMNGISVAHPDTQAEVSVRQCCTWRNSTGQFDVRVTRGSEVLHEESVTVTGDGDCNVRTQRVFVAVAP